MTRSKRMRRITDVVESQVREATRRMAESRQRLEQRETQFEELCRYREEYRGKSADYQAGGDPRRINEYRVFLTRLDEAIRHQKRLLEQARIELDRATAGWRDHQTHAKVLEKVSERFHNEERKRADRREQKEQDEIRPVFTLRHLD